MFLVEDRRPGATFLVFMWKDPREDGYKGDVAEDVHLDYDMPAVHSWPDGEDSPEACVGRSVEDPKQYTVFKYCRDLGPAGFERVSGMPLVFVSWADYLGLRRHPPDAEQIDDEQWFDYLDEVDEVARRRRDLPPDSPAGKGRDDVAAWLARKHLIADNAIREVWYLPEGAPADEIRLLELNDRLAGPEFESNPEAIDFGLDVEGARFRLSVADVTSEQLERIRENPSRLPPGWSLEEKRVWRRGA
jgi:hypothetical protein